MAQKIEVGHQLTTAVTEMLLISDPLLPPVNAELRYRGDDPYAVQLLLSIDQNPPISWVFGRELLITGISMPTGIGDVQVYPTHDGVIIELRSGGVTAKLLAYTPDLQDFADETLRMVPLGLELDPFTASDETAGSPAFGTSFAGESYAGQFRGAYGPGVHAGVDLQGPDLTAHPAPRDRFAVRDSSDS